MADDNIIRVGTSVNTSGLKSGIAEAVSVNKAGLDQLKADYAAATAAVKAAAANMASAMEQLGAAASAGNEQAIGVIKQYEDELEKASVSQQAAAESVREYTAALAEETAGAGAASAAQTEHAASLGRVISATTEARYSAQLLGRELGVPIPRALSSIASQSSLLGPLLSAAFPIIAAVGFGEILAQIVEKVIDWKEGLKEIEEDNETIGKQLEKQVAQMKKLQGEAREAAVRLVGLTRGNVAESSTKSTILGNAVENDKKNLASLETQLKALQGRIANDSKPSPGVRPDQVFSIGAFAGAGSGGAADTKKQAADLASAEKELRQVVAQLAVTHEQYTADNTKFAEQVVETGKLSTEAAKRAASELATAYRQQEAVVRKSNEDAMTELETSATQQGIIGRALTLQKIALLSQEIAADHAYTDVVRQLSAERARLGAEAAAQGAQNFNKAQQLASASIAAFSAETKRANEAEAKYFEEMLKERIKAEKEQLDADKAFLAEDSEIKTGNLETQKVATQAQQKLAPPDLSLKALNPLGNSEAVDDLKETQAIDRQILAEKIRLQQSLAAIDKASGNDKEYAKDQEKLHQLQQQSNQQQIQQNLQLTQTLRAQWQSYFSIVNQGVTQGINGLISGNETFEQATRQMLVRLLEAFADYFAQKLLLSAENWLEDAVLGKTTQSTSAELQVGSNAAVAASAAFAATAAIPIVGPALAPEAAASTYATVLGTYGPLATFETGGIVPSTGIALVHANEGVLTAPQTQWLQSMAQGSGGGGTANINTTINNSGLTDSTFQAMATKHAGHITRTVLKGMRNANLV